MRSWKAIMLWRQERNECMKNGTDRLALLKHWASVKVKPQTRHGKDRRSLQEVRAASNRSMSKPRGKIGLCWCCKKLKVLIPHHVIQLQNGGSNWHLNLEMICDYCHAEIHPWLKKAEHNLLTTPVPENYITDLY